MPRTAGVLLMGTGGSAPPHSTTYFEVQKLITSTCFTKPTLRFQKTLSFSHVQVSKLVYLSFLFYKTWTYCFLFQTACEIEDQREIHPFAFRTHTHRCGSKSDWLSLWLNLKWSSRWMISKWVVMMILISLGRVVSGWRVRNNRDWTLIGKKSPQVGFWAKIHLLGQSSPSGPANVLPSWEGDDFISGGRRCC